MKLLRPEFPVHPTPKEHRHVHVFLDPLLLALSFYLVLAAEWYEQVFPSSSVDHGTPRRKLFVVVGRQKEVDAASCTEGAST